MGLITIFSFFIGLSTAAPSIQETSISIEKIYSDRATQAENLIQTPDFKNKYQLDFKLSPSNIENIGRRMFYNEAACRTSELTAWNANLAETFPSLGTGHEIWLPAGSQEGYEESFPKLVQFLRLRLPQRGDLGMPHYLDRDNIGPSRWASAKEFNDPKNAKDLKELRDFLSHPEVLRAQTEYLIDRLRKGIKLIIAHTLLENQPTQAEVLYKNFQQMSQSPAGLRSMVDYVNFRGEGLKFGERTFKGGLHWGLKQVLLEMKVTGNPHGAFSDAAIRVLKQRAEHDRPERAAINKRSFPGFEKRINSTYRTGKMTYTPCPPFDGPALRLTGQPTRARP